MEIGFSATASHALHVVLRVPVQGPLREYARELLDVDVGVVDPAPEVLAGHRGGRFDQGGDIECSPPVRGYPFGRIITAKSAAGETNHLLPFLRGQVVQLPIEIDTSWLTVGHVDEIVSFLPVASSPVGFKVIVASPAVAQLALDAGATLGF